MSSSALWPVYAPRGTVLHPQFARTLRQRLAVEGVVIVRNLALSRPCFEQVAQAIAAQGLLGESFGNATLPGQAPLLHCAGQPLHTEGVISRRNVDATVWYATHATPGPAGALQLSYQARAVESLPPEVLDVLREHGLVYHVMDHVAFPHAPETWYEIPCLRQVDGHEVLCLALPFSPVHKAQWHVRVNGWNSAASGEFLARLQACLENPAVHHVHHWQAGDLVVTDHRRVLHGLAATEADQPIHCMRQDIAFK